MECNGHKVVKDIIYGSGSKKYRYCKHISKQRLFGLPRKLMSKGKHFILIRNPLDPSFEKVHRPSFLELGLGELVSIYSDLCQMGTPPPVIDADELQRDPEEQATLRGLCDDLEIPSQASMLTFQFLTRLYKAVTQYGKDSEFTRGRKIFKLEEHLDRLSLTRGKKVLCNEKLDR
ncbi:branched-chain-amino-acid aminotransferase-like protein 1 isoform X3 [Raphanus sativus]|uniref:Branched-chain-amino-acid aminotransferase-like protein 1 isoform X3 n=1 Tax=Raphanus sativus TaxID=3726 RepID=A0A9W3CPC7_RAPSA|nr:branched-chain-amino-acid aminotransferase-like protein 1 isoform X3 [Raphanus sativus]